MEMDINKMFQDKNKEIFRNSLTLEMERNLEALKHTTDYLVALEINKLMMFFSKYFEEVNIEYKKEELLGILYKEKIKLNNIVNAKIEDKKIRIKENFLSKEINDNEIKEEYLDSYAEELQKETERLNSELDLALKKEICTNFSSEILKKYKMTDINQIERINSRINILFRDTIIRRIKEESEFRDESLKNMSSESYNKYVDLNSKTLQ